jgi:multiple sugar transport system permease protein
MVDPTFANDRRRAANLVKKFILGLFRFIVLVGISYVILGPIIGMVANSFFSDDDAYSPLVYLIPMEPTLERYQAALVYLKYWSTLKNTTIYVLTLMVIQVVVCSMVGYGFARYEFPFKKLLFGCVVVMIVIPINTIMLPLYMTFRSFDPFGIVTAIRGEPINLMSTPAPIYIMTIFGTGLRAGLYIYIFNQFFRGLPKEIEEAAFVDGAGMWYTYFRIMLVNALPSVVTVAIFSLVWQYNDTFYANLFNVDSKIVLSKAISSLQATISNAMNVNDPTIAQLYLYAGIVLVILPVLLIYCILQKQFIEGVERSGIVG